MIRNGADSCHRDSKGPCAETYWILIGPRFSFTFLTRDIAHFICQNPFWLVNGTGL